MKEQSQAASYEKEGEAESAKPEIHNKTFILKGVKNLDDNDEDGFEDETISTSLESSITDLHALEEGSITHYNITSSDTKEQHLQVAFSKRPGVALALVLCVVVVVALSTALWLWLALRNFDENEPFLNITLDVSN